MKKLPSELKTKINKIAHAAGVAHGEQVRLQLLIEIDRRINAGESQDAMLAALGLRAFTDANIAAMTMTEAELMGGRSNLWRNNLGNRME